VTLTGLKQNISLRTRNLSHSRLVGSGRSVPAGLLRSKVPNDRAERAPKRFTAKRARLAEGQAACHSSRPDSLHARDLLSEAARDCEQDDNLGSPLGSAT